MIRSLVITITFAIAGCLGGDAGPSIRDYVAEVSTADGTHATFVAGAPPREGSGEQPAVTTNAAVIPGGTTPTTLVATGAFSTAIVAVDGLAGYYRVDLPEAEATVQLLITLSQELTATDFVWLYGIGAGSVFGYTPAPVTVVPVGTGDVQVSLSWTTQADVDLHVVDPAGEEIYWDHRDAASGGQLDLDSNAACVSDGPRNENITWPMTGAPDGTYQVRVDYWSSCGASSTPFVVTVNVRGRDPDTFAGMFTGGGDRGGLGAGQPITTFSTGAGARAATHAAVGSFEVVPNGVTYTK